jgi:GT2 family glycosyltransferase
MLQEDVAAADRAEEVFGPCAGAAMYRKEMLLDIGLFDEDFFLYMEDVDLAMRGRLAGWRCMYVPFAKVVHHHGGTAGEGSDLTIFYGNRNIIWYTVKCLPAGLLLAYLPWIVCRNIAVMVHYMALGKGQLILKSKLSALVGLPRMVRKRKAVVRRAQSNEIARFINTWAAIPRR